jgi:hypothetical protein
MTQDLIKRLRDIAMLESANDVYLAENSAEWEAANALEEQALALDIQAGSIEAVQSANSRLAAKIEALKAERDEYQQAADKMAVEQMWTDRAKVLLETWKDEDVGKNT